MDVRQLLIGDSSTSGHIEKWTPDDRFSVHQKAGTLPSEIWRLLGWLQDSSKWHSIQKDSTLHLVVRLRWGSSHMTWLNIDINHSMMFLRVLSFHLFDNSHQTSKSFAQPPHRKSKTFKHTDASQVNTDPDLSEFSFNDEISRKFSISGNEVEWTIKLWQELPPNPYHNLLRAWAQLFVWQRVDCLRSL
jgi:hypothetical protein